MHRRLLNDILDRLRAIHRPLHGCLDQGGGNVHAQVRIFAAASGSGSPASAVSQGVKPLGSPGSQANTASWATAMRSNLGVFTMNPLVRQNRYGGSKRYIQINQSSNTCNGR